ncbi:MAG: FeoB-associated Cys-rich membrane protein [Erysipelotrichaceae bacterium]|nr:FeoB-associated Cys-rich membrane protein [Erysipelotrichaceae bacterium]
MADMIVLTLIIGYSVYLIYKEIHKMKHPDPNCNHICTGCTGCSDTQNIFDQYYADKQKEVD